MAKYTELDEQAIKFAEYYILTGGNALESAKASGYDNPLSAAKRLASKDSPVWEIIDEYRKSSKVMTPIEIMERLTLIGRGEAKTKVHIVVGDTVKVVEVTPTIAEQLAALKTLAKINGLDKQKKDDDGNGNVVIQITGENELED